MTAEMFDSVDPSQIPAGQDAAGYVDGHWQTFKVIHGTHTLSVAVFASDDADALDVEPGDAVNSQAPGWVDRELQLGHWRPCCYTSVSNGGTLLQTLAAAGISRQQIRLWTAHYTGRPHICDQSCGLPAGVTADATQWTDASGGRNLDESTVADNFFPAAAALPGAPAPTPAPQEDDMAIAEIWHDNTNQYIVWANGTKSHVPDPASGSALEVAPALVYRQVPTELLNAVPDAA